MKAISAGPYQFSSLTSHQVALTYLLALAPSFLWSAWRFGPSTLLLPLAGIITSWGLYTLFMHLQGKPPLQWSFALLTGVLTTAYLPSGTPWHTVPLAVGFAMVMGFILWGGYGKQWFNAAGLGVLFVFLSWPHLYREVAPGLGTALHADWYHHVLQQGVSPGLRPTEIIDTFSRGSLVPVPDLVQNWIPYLGLSIPPGIVSMLLGFDGQLLGASSVPLLLAGSVILMARRILDWRIPLVSWTLAALTVMVFGGLVNGGAWGRGDVVFFLLDGNMLLTVFFASALPGQTPHRSAGRWLHALVLGLFLALAALFANHELAYLMAVLGTNLLLPGIESVLGYHQPRIREAR